MHAEPEALIVLFEWASLHKQGVACLAAKIIPPCLESVKRYYFCGQEMWINLRLIATTKKNAKAIALSLLIPFTINPTIVKHELAMTQQLIVLVQ
ncbi:MAG: hypothetical protein AB7V25_00625 [Mangrovibacterium sp.]